mgnify:CR=1 FL=1
MFKTKRIVYVHDVRVMNQHLRFCRHNRIEGSSEAWIRLQQIPKAYYTLEVMYARIILRYTGNGNPYTEYIFLRKTPYYTLRIVATDQVWNPEIWINDNLTESLSLSRNEAIDKMHKEAYHVMQGLVGINPGDPTYNTNQDIDTYQKTM